MGLGDPLCRTKHCFDWRSGAGNDLNLPMESNYVRQPRPSQSPPSSPNDDPKVPATGIWTALPEASRRQILNILMRMVMERMAVRPAEREVRHDQ